MCLSCWQLSAESTVNTYQSVRFARITPCASSCFKVIKEQNKIRHVWRKRRSFRYSALSWRPDISCEILSQGIMLDRGWGIVWLYILNCGLLCWICPKTILIQHIWILLTMITSWFRAWLCLFLVDNVAIKNKVCFLTTLFANINPWLIFLSPNFSRIVVFPFPHPK